MPLRKVSKKAKMSKKARQKVASANIREMHHSATFRRTKKKFGVAKARAQAIAAGMRAAGIGRPRKKRK